MLVTDGEQILIEKRGGEDVWAGLYQFPLIEAQDSALLTNAEFEDMLGLNGVQIFKSTVLKKHILSHQDIFATICWAQATSFSNVNFLTAKPSDLHTFAVPRLLDRFLETADLSVLF